MNACQSVTKISGTISGKVRVDGLASARAQPFVEQVGDQENNRDREGAEHDEAVRLHVLLAVDLDQDKADGEKECRQAVEGCIDGWQAME